MNNLLKVIDNRLCVCSWPQASIILVTLLMFFSRPILAQDTTGIGQSNLTGQSELSFPRHPYSAQFIARGGETMAGLLRNAAHKLNSVDSVKLETTVNVLLLSGAAAGVAQTGHADCWFESALAALARIPGGPQSIADMITQESSSSYLVNFPGASKPIYITALEVAQYSAKDSGPWARVLQAAATKNWPNLCTDGMQKFSPYRNTQSIVIGMEILTGHQANFIDITLHPKEMIAQILEEAAAKQQPMTAATYPKNAQEKQVVLPSHAYTVLAYDGSKSIVTLRNPWGYNSTPDNKLDYPKLPETGQEVAGIVDLGAGVIQMAFPVFLQHFHFICWDSFKTIPKISN